SRNQEYLATLLRTLRKQPRSSRLRALRRSCCDTGDARSRLRRVVVLGALATRGVCLSGARRVYRPYGPNRQGSNGSPSCSCVMAAKSSSMWTRKALTLETLFSSNGLSLSIARRRAVTSGTRLSKSGGGLTLSELSSNVFSRFVSSFFLSVAKNRAAYAFARAVFRLAVYRSSATRTLDT